ncbi:hypothetical protein Q1695_005655 [Nippostrongylus brasiliensis]|nr:hypothetical protein Q1695_005655 [Nippostrongylus brasiliensis]
MILTPPLEAVGNTYTSRSNFCRTVLCIALIQELRSNFTSRLEICGSQFYQGNESRVCMSDEPSTQAANNWQFGNLAVDYPGAEGPPKGVIGRQIAAEE